MEQHFIRASASGDPVPQVLYLWLRAFRPHFTGPSWHNLLVLVMGALLAPGKPTVSAGLRMTGWQVKVTFLEVRAHLGVETQRQWSDKAIGRTTPALMGLYGLVTLWADDLLRQGAKPQPESAPARLGASDCPRLRSRSGPLRRVSLG